MQNTPKNLSSSNLSSPGAKNTTSNSHRLRSSEKRKKQDYANKRCRLKRRTMPEVTISYIPDCPKHVRLAESGPVQPFAARLPEQPQAPRDHLLHIQGTRLRS